MTYGAMVPCRCHEALGGRQVIPDWLAIEVDECGEVSIEPTVRWSARREAASAAWVATWCPHVGFSISDDFDVNFWAMGAFRRAVHEAGDLPVLASRLPTSNDGCIPYEEVARAIAELDRFRIRAAGVPMHRMLDSDTGSVLRELAMSEDGVFALDGTHGLQFGFDEHGFFVLQDEGPRPVPVELPVGGGIVTIPLQPIPLAPPRIVEAFRARRVLQLEDGPPDAKHQPVKLIDRDTGREFRSPVTAVRADVLDDRGRLIPSPPIRHFHVDTVPRPDDWFDFLLVPLRRMLVIAHDNQAPLVWT